MYQQPQVFIMPTVIIIISPSDVLVITKESLGGLSFITRLY